MLFDWLIVGLILAINPAHAARGPKHVIARDKTAVLTAEQARELLDSIPLTRSVEWPDGTTEERPCLAGLRDRALIAAMTYSFARIGAVVAMRDKDYYPQGKRSWVRLHEKGGKRHEMPAHHNLEAYLDAYIEAAGIRDETQAPLFRSAVDSHGHAHRTAHASGGCLFHDPVSGGSDRLAGQSWRHTFRATGITAYLENGGTLENAQAMAAHESPRTTKLYDHTGGMITLDEVEKITIRNVASQEGKNAECPTT